MLFVLSGNMQRKRRKRVRGEKRRRALCLGADPNAQSILPTVRHTILFSVVVYVLNAWLVWFGALSNIHPQEKDTLAIPRNVISK